MESRETLERRLEFVANLYNYLEDMIDKLPDQVPKSVRSKIIELILGDKELKDLINGFKGKRAPRFILMGKTGVGKSSLVNAMFGRYMAAVSDVNIGTLGIHEYNYEIDGTPVLNILDTRGIGESIKSHGNTAEEELLSAIEDFNPDAVLFLLNAKDRARINEDVESLKDVAEKWRARNKIGRYKEINIPIIVVLNQVDLLAPDMYKDPNNYPKRKLDNIQSAVLQVRKILEEKNVTYTDMIPVSSLIDWGMSPDELANLSKAQLEALEMEIDCRYNINSLLDILENNIDAKAAIGLLLATRFQVITKRVSEKLTNIFSGIAAVIATTPIPVSDVFILTALQAILVMIIAALSGREVSFKTAQELLVSLGGTGAAGYGLRVLFQQSSKLLNVVFPGAGSAVSATIAGAGTKLIGTAAIKYYIEDISIEDLNQYVKRQSKNIG